MEFETMDNRHETNLVPHINLVCKICGKIQDFEEGVVVYTDDVEEKFDFEVEDYRMEYYGVCAECRSKTSNVNKRKGV
jgi:Fur family peroxide stress response transcriptional regulator